MDVKTYDELFEESQHLYADAKAIVANAAASAEDGDRLAGEEFVVGFPGGPIQDVLEGRGHGVVVFRAGQVQNRTDQTTLSLLG